MFHYRASCASDATPFPRLPCHHRAYRAIAVPAVHSCTVGTAVPLLFTCAQINPGYLGIRIALSEITFDPVNVYFMFSVAVPLVYSHINQHPGIIKEYQTYD